MKKFKTFRELHLELLKDPEDAKMYLEIALEEYEKDQDKEAFLQAIRDVAEVRGGLAKLAKRIHLTRQNLQKVLFSKKVPKLETIGIILHGLGFRLSVEFLSKKAA